MKRFLFAALLLNTFVHAQTNGTMTDGNQLRDKCKFFFSDLTENTPTTTTNMERVDMGYCAGYLDAFTDVEGLWHTVEGTTSKATHYCMPHEVTKGQMLLVIKKWMENHPEKLHLRASTVIHNAFLEAFPCK